MKKADRVDSWEVRRKWADDCIVLVSVVLAFCGIGVGIGIGIGRMIVFTATLSRFFLFRWPMWMVYRDFGIYSIG